MVSVQTKLLRRVGGLRRLVLFGGCALIALYVIQSLLLNAKTGTTDNSQLAEAAQKDQSHPREF